jgi:hypothetical protein
MSSATAQTKTSGATWGDHHEDYGTVYPDPEPGTDQKCFRCQYCDGHNPEYVSECGYCDRCTYCGEVLPRGATPEEGYRLREPHRKTHLYQASARNRTAARRFNKAEQDSIINEGEGVLASNLSSLDLTGTHYGPLDDMVTPSDDDPFFNW